MDVPRRLAPSTTYPMQTELAPHPVPNMYGNPIDLTGDDDDDDLCRPSASKRPRSIPTLAQPPPPPPLWFGNAILHPSPGPSPPPSSLLTPLAPSQTAFGTAPHFAISGPPRLAASPSSSALPGNQVIDLTGSPSPPTTPQGIPQALPGLPVDLPPKTPVCIGLLNVTALVLYPIPYLHAAEPGGPDAEWAPVRLQHEHNQSKPETIHIKAPSWKNVAGEMVAGEGFAVVEQKVAKSLVPMLAKGLIRLDGKVRRGGLPILPLQLLVFTPKGNIPVVGHYLQQHGLFLDHPTLAHDLQRLATQHYVNPHNPPPGGHAQNLLPAATNRLGYAAVGSPNSRWTSPSVGGKSVEVQRSQAEELFKSLKGGDELEETEPSPNVATKLYPHQKKAITFLLERERERTGPNGQASSLWQARANPFTGQVAWTHLVTQKEITREPFEAKGSILADDMGLGKTITCVSLIAATLESAAAFAASPVETPPSVGSTAGELSAHNFSGSVWGMPEAQGSISSASSSKAKAKAEREHDKLESEYARRCRIKVKTRATLIVCPLSTISNWEEQFREHWKGPVTVVGGSSGVSCATATRTSSMPSLSSLSLSQPLASIQPSQSKLSTEERKMSMSPTSSDAWPLRVYVYHGNARRPDPTFLADFDAVITTFSTLATEYSKQSRSVASSEMDDDDDDDDCDGIEYDARGNQVLKLPGSKGKKRKKVLSNHSSTEVTSPLQSVHWFRVVLDEAHCIKETGTVGCRASCDLMADRRLCLTGTPVQNKLDDVFALIKFLRLDPLDDKNVWSQFIGTPVKYGQPLGVARLQTIMKCITLRRTKESRAQDGQKILSLPPRRDELRLLKFDAQEQGIYDQFYAESKQEFAELSDRNEVMKNYVGILQKILRLRQICDHFELVEGKGLFGDGSSQEASSNYEDVVQAIIREGINPSRAAAVFAILRESATAQCVECGCDMGNTDGQDGANVPDMEATGPAKRGRKAKASSSRVHTRQNSPSTVHPVLTRCQHLFCIECYRRCICPNWPSVSPDTIRACSACQTALRPSDAAEISAHSSAENAPKKKATKKEKRQKGVSMANFRPSTKVKALLGDLVQFSKANPHSANYDPASIEIQMVDDQGNEVDEGPVKTVVFSQWTTMLDKIEDALEVASIRYERLDGTMKRDDRTKAMEALKHDPSCEVLLVSLKAGGVGLNLTAAQRVYLMDPYWNPAVENQAVDRIHRLGQTRPVTTIKLIIDNTIEARLLEVQRKKTALANMTLGQNFSKAEMLQRRMEELQELFT